MPAIELSGVSKRYGDVTALTDLNVTVDEGEIYGFLGPNGAGKSTAINILLDFVRPTTGSATILGYDAQADSQAIRQRIGVLPEGFSVYDRLTARKHVEFAIDSKNATNDPDALLDRVGIPEAADRKAGGFSTGMRQRLGLAIALVGDPEMLLLDEPSSGLDPNGAREMRSILTEEANRGTTVFFSSHILGQVEAICDHAGILQNGTLVAEDSIDALREATDATTTLTVTLDAVTDDAVAAANAIPGVSEVSVDASDLVVRTGDASKTDVLDAIESTGATVQDFATEDASLDDVFSAYTTEEMPA
ncbi:MULTISPECIES: ABC transporter ATP-binding protein [Halobacterium]|uniref:ABC transporter ATP-binding protein n=1 Tax=Halobacterium TaxID=2239 RepID=UPI001F3D91EC|nr:ABC transporter ATP-binding protein [Halobacterium salinarum]MCF2164344.1 ABC transporter ATP-binding protein [Halobacterium salinarum]MCF2167131.1 ABC transporter ATP-binding protein [Halobacterium salinarum]MCF2239090.1 ABC transporter ATP-binding protein [Halobacterium salinarum]MDL0127113.1 ABC transporter ATP-binding protein [Halobacterium salinarum]MDL0144226.1 ABC transporter ATP-binding protein [Halobacterium salinarum]